MDKLDKNEVVKELRRSKAVMEKYLRVDDDDEEKWVAAFEEVCNQDIRYNGITTLVRIELSEALCFC